MTAQSLPAARSILVQDARMTARNSAEKRFRLYGLTAIVFSLGMLGFILWTIFSAGISSFSQASVAFPLELTEKALDPKAARDPAQMAKVTTVGYGKLIANGLKTELATKGIVVEGLTDKDITAFLSKEAAAVLRDRVLANPALIGTTIDMSAFASGRIDGYLKGRVNRETAANDANVTPAQLDLADILRNKGILTEAFNWGFIAD